MSNVIENARKALEETELAGSDVAKYHALKSAVEALRELLESIEYEYAIHSSMGEHIYPVDEQERPMTAPTLWEVSEALGGHDPDYWDAGDVIVKRFFGPWEKVS